jgi:hypothetical protein
MPFDARANAHAHATTSAERSAIVDAKTPDSV